ncbi:MAG: AAA family ATPase [Clostridiales bacterium]|jgi:predicted ATP-dependent endonuclease of OLD family|nr:AAA family ATPase [Clostridiales bacterium]
MQMVVKNATIYNFKSLGNQKNRIQIEKDVTVLLGKNESGKSNILNAMNSLNLKQIEKEKFSTLNKNRKLNDAINFRVETEFVNGESIDINETTFFTFNVDDVCFSGGLSSAIQRNNKLKISIELLSTLKSNVHQNFITAFNTCMASLQNLDKKIFFNYNQLISEIPRFFNLATLTEEKNESLNSTIECLIKEISDYYNLFPRFYLYNDKGIKDNYSKEEIKREYKNNTSSIPIIKLFKYLDIKEVDLLSAMELATDPTVSQNRNNILKLFEEKVNKEFSQFYTQEKIDVKLVFDSGLILFQVESEDTIFNYSERSNGLKWYFNLFISLLAENILNNNVVILIDEPGVYLHINAQEELMNFFKDLCAKNKQIIYTTHSPYMIDTECLKNIRLIEKFQGNTLIYNNHYDDLHDSSKKDALSPLIKAIGANFCKLNPDLNRLNIITEGITDYLYIKAMLKNFDIKKDELPFILPSIGAGNIHDIATILIGWGCHFKVVIDYDKAGWDELERLKKLELKEGVDVFCVNCKTANKIDMKEHGESIESLVSLVDKENLPNDKTLAAKQFHDKVIENELQPSKETVENFKKLFVKLGLIGVNVKNIKTKEH